MERIALLIESTNTLIRCLLNPEDRESGFTIQRSSGLAREDTANLSETDLSDNPVVARSRGDTRMTLKLLFDVDLVGSTAEARDVRELTNPIWQLTEYASGSRQSRDLPRVRLFWGKGWEIPVVVESVAERYERFTSQGLPQRSWMTLGLLRINDQVPSPVSASLLDPATIPTTQELAVDDPSWGVHELLVGGVEGEALWELAYRYYGDPALWRLIASANDIEDPLNIPAGKLLRIPPKKALRWTSSLA